MKSEEPKRKFFDDVPFKLDYCSVWHDDEIGVKFHVDGRILLLIIKDEGVIVYDHPEPGKLKRIEYAQFAFSVVAEAEVADYWAVEFNELQKRLRAERALLNNPPRRPRWWQWRQNRQVRKTQTEIF